MPSNKKALFSSESTDWGTPKELFQALDRRYHFTVDVAASEENAKCARFYTKEQDGLKQSWKGEVVWCNPPYGRDVGRWIAKAITESKDAITVMLLPARTDTKWFHGGLVRFASVYFLAGRLRFEGAPSSAPFPSLIAVFGLDPKTPNVHGIYVERGGIVYSDEII